MTTGRMLRVISYGLVAITAISTSTLSQYTIPPERRGSWGAAGYSSTSRVVPRSFNLIYDIKQVFGALGDGVTNDSPALAAAINNYIGLHASVPNGLTSAVILFPAGTYLLSSQVLLQANCNGLVLRGAGSNNTTLLFHSTSNMPSLINVQDAQNIGIENITIARDNIAGHLSCNIEFDNCASCWVYGIESIKPMWYHVLMNGGNNIVVKGNYLHDAEYYNKDSQIIGPHTHGYGVCVAAGANHCLIEDNILQHLRHGIAFSGGAHDNVAIYNYVRDGNAVGDFFKVVWFYNQPYKDWDILFHGNGNGANLFEGNDVDILGADSNSGLCDLYNTFFRNRVRYNRSLLLRGFDETTRIHAVPGLNFVANTLTQDDLTEFAPAYEESCPSLFDVYSHAEFADRNITHAGRTGGEFEEWQLWLQDYSYYYTDCFWTAPECENVPGVSWPPIGPRRVSNDPYPFQYNAADYRYNHSAKKTVDAPSMTATRPFYLNVPGDYADISSAASNAICGQTINVLSGSYTISSNLALASGVSLTLRSGVTINLNGHSIVTSGCGVNTVAAGAVVNGAVIQGAAGGLFPSVQSAIDHATNGQTVQLLARTYTESPSLISRSNISLAGQGQGSSVLTGGISLTSCSNVYVTGLTAATIYMNNNATCMVSYVTITGASLATIYGGSQNNIYNTTANNVGASFGLTAYGGTGNLVYSSISTGDCAVYLTSGASFNIATNNSFCCNGVDIYAVNGGYAYASNNTYSRSLPSSIYGNVFVSGVNGVCSSGCENESVVGGSSTSFSASPRPQTSVVSSDPTSIQKLDDAYLALMRKIHPSGLTSPNDIQTYLSDYSALAEGYKTLIQIGSSTALVKASLAKLSALYMDMGDNAGFLTYLQSPGVTSLARELRPFVERHFIWNSVGRGDYQRALGIANEVLASTDSTTDLAAEMLYEKLLLYSFYLKDVKRAAEQRDVLARQCSSSLLARFAVTELGAISPQADAPIIAAPAGTQTDADLGLSAFPNPFNPTSQVRFTLASSAHVNLVIYDILGREVISLINGDKGAGSYTATFDASRLSSGIYLARLTVVPSSGKPLVRTIRMSLVK